MVTVPIDLDGVRKTNAERQNDGDRDGEPLDRVDRLIRRRINSEFRPLLSGGALHI